MVNKMPDDFNMSMSPETAQQLLNEGKISQSTYQAAIGNPEQQASYQPTPISDNSLPENAYGSAAPNQELPQFDNLRGESQPPSSSQQPISSSSSTGLNFPNEATTPKQQQPNDPNALNLPTDTITKNTPITLAPLPKGMNSQQADLANTKSFGEDSIANLQTQKDSNSELATAKEQGAREAYENIQQTKNDRIQQQKDLEAFHYKSQQEQKTVDDSSTAEAKRIAKLEVDPNKGVNDINPIAKVLLIIGAGLTQAGGGEGLKSAMSYLNEKNKASADAQWKKIENQKDGWQMERNVAARQAARDGDQEKFMVAKGVESWRTHQLELDGIETKTKSAEIKASAQQANSAIDAQVNGILKAFGDKQVQLLRSSEQAGAAAAANQLKQHQKTQDDIRTRSQHYIDNGVDPTEAVSRANAEYGWNPDNRKFGALPSKEEREAASKGPNEAQQKTATEIKQGKEDLKELDNYRSKVATISPSVVEGLSPDTRGKIQAEQARYEAFVYRQVAKMYKMDTTAQEPKNIKLIEHFAKPYLPNSQYEPIEVTRRRMDNLEHDMHSNMAGITGQTAPEQRSSSSKPADTTGFSGVTK